jgi:hypothetical protein
LERARLRRRLARQERVREAMLLDLGAIIFELHRQGRREPELLRAKAADLADVDLEVRALTKAVGEGYALPELTARGLVAACTACGGIMGVRDRHCPTCGAAAGAHAGTEAAEDEPAAIEDDGYEPAGVEDGADEPAGVEYKAAAVEERGRNDEEIAVHAAEPQPVEASPRPASNGDMPPGYADPPRPVRPVRGEQKQRPAPRMHDEREPREPIVPRAQRTLRAGRRMARSWIDERRSGGR